jgi:prepilin-type N-terminal cleavage/methylation domain-containing protein
MLTPLKNTKKGFTLIELLVVIVIIAMLSAIVMAALSNSRSKSRDARRISDIGQIQLALELYYDGHRSYPSTTPVCSPACARPAATDVTVQMLAQPTPSQPALLKQTPIPPMGGSPLYIYRGTSLSGGAVTECTAIGIICTSYVLAINLERTDSHVLKADADQRFPLVAPVFFGNSQNCLAEKISTELCYDVIK